MKKMSKGMLMTALICGAVYLGGSPVYANELQEFALDEYVVTAARTETKLVDTPANISVVDAQTIEERHYKDVSEVLKDVPGIGFTLFKSSDVVRHPLVQRIVEAYASYDAITPTDSAREPRP